MCCCGKGIINGEEGYSWDGKTFGVRKPFFPEMEEDDELVKDLPGRCGKIDSHSYDMRLVKSHGSLFLLIRHGGGQERLRLHAYGLKDFILNMSDNDCYWFMLEIYHVQKDAASEAKQAEASKWRKAAAEKRIRTKKQRNSNFVNVWIEAPEAVA